MSRRKKKKTLIPTFSRKREKEPSAGVSTSFPLSRLRERVRVRVFFSVFLPVFVP
jgi:hypothetical protein